MKMKNYEIVSCLGILQDYLGYELKSSVVEIYVNSLKGLDDGMFKSALMKIINEFKPTSVQPFPLISTILELLGQDGHTRAVNAVTAVKNMALLEGSENSVDFGDRTLHAIIDRFGGWEIVAHWISKDWQLNERNFINAYQAALSSGIKGNSYCMGSSERTSRANGYPPERLLEMGIDPKKSGFLENSDKDLIEIKSEKQNKSSELSKLEFKV